MRKQNLVVVTIYYLLLLRGGEKVASFSYPKTKSAFLFLRQQQPGFFFPSTMTMLFSSNSEFFDNDRTTCVYKETTRKWCENFVLQYGLCPFASASIRNNHVRIHVLQSNETTLENWKHDIRKEAERFYGEYLKEPSTFKALSSAITFCVFPDSSLDFEDFYYWFNELEDEWMSEDENVDNNLFYTAQQNTILAPFHPEWAWYSQDDESDGSSSISIEKQSPFPTVSIVARKVIDEDTTLSEQIMEANQSILSSKSYAEWKRLYEQAVNS